MIIRATQKKMMSKPVTSTDDGRNVRSSRVSRRPAQRRMAPQRGGEPGVEHVVVAAKRCGLAAELRARLRARRAFVARDIDVAELVVPRRNLVAPPELARDAPVLDVVDPVQVGATATPAARRRPSRPRPARRAGRPSPTAARHRSWIELAREAPDASPAPAWVMATNHWSVSIGSTTSPVRPQRGTTILCAFSRRSRPAAARSASTALRAA